MAFDTNTKLDGPMIVTGLARDLAGNVLTCSATVTVDNVSIDVSPDTLNLKSKGNFVTVECTGTSVGLLLPTELADITLGVPGGSPSPRPRASPATTRWDAAARA